LDIFSMFIDDINIIQSNSSDLIINYCLWISLNIRGEWCLNGIGKKIF
jgi:hypothetical protein